jgi:hypothetical protein
MTISKTFTPQINTSDLESTAFASKIYTGARQSSSTNDYTSGNQYIWNEELENWERINVI